MSSAAAPDVTSIRPQEVSSPMTREVSASSPGVYGRQVDSDETHETYTVLCVFRPGVSQTNVSIFNLFILSTVRPTTYGH